MSNEQSMRRVTAIRNGTVIDHVPSGQALRVLEMLGIAGETSVPVSLVMNVPSKKLGSKDIIKVALTPARRLPAADTTKILPEPY